MDVDTESVLKLIAPEGAPASWKDNPDFYGYLSKLGGYNVDQLCKEPDHLNAEKVAIQNQTQDLAFANYKTFIRTAECSREIFHEFNKTEERLDSLLNELPGLTNKCEDFIRCCEDMKTRRKVNTVCLTRHSSLLQTLEIPQLMETLIREGSYEEALQLANYVKRFGKTHSNIPIIQSIVEDVEKWWWVLLQRLVSELGTELQLPRCLQVVGLLRRMDVISEVELRLKFLQARDSYFHSLLNAVPKDDASQHLSKTIEISRTQIFNIVTQYRAVFSEEEVQHTSRPRLNQILLLQAWINDKVNEFVTTVRQDLTKGVGPNLPSLLNQAMYFGQSLSRVGADLRAVLAPLFLSQITNNLTLALKQASGRFHADMEKFTLTQETLFRGRLTESEEKPQANSAPSSLLEFYPLSNCCNNLLSALNDLRLCAPLSLAQTTTNLLNQTLVSVSNDILQFYRREQQAMSKEEMENLTKFCVCFSDHLVGYIQQCLQQVYSPSELSSFLGIPPSKLQGQNLAVLNKKLITDPICHLLPPELPLSIPQHPTLTIENT